jgi:hypothetical protein
MKAGSPEYYESLIADAVAGKLFQGATIVWLVQRIKQFQAERGQQTTARPGFELAERFEKRLPNGAVVVELWCSDKTRGDKEATALLRAQAAALRQMAEGLEKVAGPGFAPPKPEGEPS